MIAIYPKNAKLWGRGDVGKAENFITKSNETYHLIS